MAPRKNVPLDTTGSSAKEPDAKKPRLAASSGSVNATNDGDALADHASGGPVVPVGKLDLSSLGLMPKVPVIGSDRTEWEGHYSNIVGWTRKAISLGLLEWSIKVPDIGLAVPTRIKENMSDSGQNVVTTFRSDWDVDRAVQSMETTGMYENNGTAHWLAVGIWASVFQWGDHHGRAHTLSTGGGSHALLVLGSLLYIQ